MLKYNIMTVLRTRFWSKTYRYLLLNPIIRSIGNDGYVKLSPPRKFNTRTATDTHVMKMMTTPLAAETCPRVDVRHIRMMCGVFVNTTTIIAFHFPGSPEHNAHCIYDSCIQRPGRANIRTSLYCYNTGELYPGRGRTVAREWMGWPAATSQKRVALYLG
jgi:hypothetical protein